MLGGRGGRKPLAWRKDVQPPDPDPQGGGGVGAALIGVCQKLCHVHCKAASPLQTIADQVR